MGFAFFVSHNLGREKNIRNDFLPRKKKKKTYFFSFARSDVKAGLFFCSSAFSKARAFSRKQHRQRRGLKTTRTKVRSKAIRKSPALIRPLFMEEKKKHCCFFFLGRKLFHIFFSQPKPWLKKNQNQEKWAAYLYTFLGNSKYFKKRSYTVDARIQVPATTLMAYTPAALMATNFFIIIIAKFVWKR